MRLSRSCGILLHPTSLPGPFGIGDLGSSARDFVEFLAETGQSWWQMLPLGPIGPANSPYQSASSFAGNPLLISLESLVDEGLLETGDLIDYPRLPEGRADYEAAGANKDALLRRAFRQFPNSHPEFDRFRRRQADWLDDFALYMALKLKFSGRDWTRWRPELTRRDPSALAYWREKLESEIRFVQFTQFLFERQWAELRRICETNRVRLIGDVPIFVSHDSAEVWTRPELFELDQEGRPTAIAGVPPDYFNKKGQYWGNPLYCWPAHEAEGYAWWLSRFRKTLERVDLIRLDHFRGFESYWSIPPNKARTAIGGKWVPGPGARFLRAMKRGLKRLPLIAEDLGDITPEVLRLRDEFELPGMRVLQFGFGSGSTADQYLPYRYVPHCVVYTGTHDNDTTVGWFTSEQEQAFVCRYLGTDGSEIHWDLIRAAFTSVADLAIVPLQDVLGLDNSARMNYPGVAAGNWLWRFLPGSLTPAIRDRLADLTAISARWNGSVAERFRTPRDSTFQAPAKRTATRTKAAGGVPRPTASG
jgi:4-alpha-glucanotransferase